MQAYASYLVKVCMNKYAYKTMAYMYTCLLYTSDAADDMQCVDLGGRRIIKKRL